MIKHIVFDFGGVILDLDGVHTGYPNDLSLIFDLPIEEAKKIWNESKTAVMTGKESPKEFLARMKKSLELDFDVDEALQFWEMRNAISKDRIDWLLVAILEQLKKSYQVHMLTDQIKLDNGAGQWIDEINRHFHTILKSYEQGHRKPAPEAYTNMLQKISAETEPETVVFIDDNQKNIEAAEELGIHGILYTYKDHTHLKKNLGRAGCGNIWVNPKT